MLLKQEGLETSFRNMFLNVLVRLSEWEGNQQKRIQIYIYTYIHIYIYIYIYIDILYYITLTSQWPREALGKR